jgi:hypothetical protein
MRPTLHMKNLSWFKSILLIAAGSVLATGCVTRERVVYQPVPPPPPQWQPAPPPQEVVVTEPPPPPPVIVESVTLAPGPSYVYIGGAWVWHGRWVWQPSRWVHPPRYGAVWVPQHYANHNGVHVFVGGYWR